MPPVAQSSPSELHRDRQKKPRHRHSPAQLAALNELFEKDEHPALELRQSLAERLGMETKTVNAWFQNKRASSKKRTVTRPLPDSDANSISLASNSHPSNQPHSDPDYFYDDIYPPYDYPSQHSNPPGRSQSQSANSDYPQFLAENDSMPRRMRVRPSIEQTEELKKLFSINPHPSTEQRQSLADRIGMRYQSVTNWFQNQRSIAKKKKEDDNPYPESSNDTRTYSGFPPPSQFHPSLGLPPSTSRPSLPSASSRSRRSLSPGYDDLQSRRSNPRRSVTPYSISMTSRPRRSRPEPHQLAALNDLYNKNAHPSIEERSSLALEIGMDLGKVTNWFRNLRQTKRRHAKKAGTGSGSGDEDDYYPNDHHVSVSRSGSPSSSSSMDEDGPLRSGTISGSEDEYEEPVTPRSESSPSPFMPAVPLSRISLKALSLAAIEPAAAAFKTDFDRVSVKSSNGIKIEDALLLLTFHRQDVRIDI
ncbi:distal-less homeobox 3 [Moniliophthora roreri]|uniref:Homeobox domain-containing protein n=1 Tax=Moniliophthora roreri TaxID=221103 RepID=A0A0W0FMG2_MONRR|nr:distal-less homeobox 3 [Moniliophthora roreri]